MKKFLVILTCILAIGGTVGSVFFGIKWNAEKSEREVLIRQNGELQKSIDAIGPVTQVFTVTAPVKAGKEITKDDIDKQTIPVSSVTESYVTSEEDIIGKYFKVSLTPGTSLTKDVIMEDSNDNTLYVRDITFKTVPIGLAIGDYIDLRIVLPYGEEMIGLEHKRVMRRIENTITLNLDEGELAIYTSLLTDKAKYTSKGLRTYATPYVEPGVSKSALPFYPVRKEMEAIVVINPNIKDKKRCINTALRADIDTRLANVTDADGGIISGGITEEQSQINNAEKNWAKTTDEGSTSEEIKYPAGDPTIPLPDKDKTTEDQSKVTDKQKEEIKGSDLFDKEEVIN